MYAFGKFIGSRLGIKVQKLRFGVLRTSKATHVDLVHISLLLTPIIDYDRFQSEFDLQYKES